MTLFGQLRNILKPYHWF